MIRLRDETMGRFSVEVELANYVDVEKALAGEIPRDQVRQLTIEGVVDTGATRLVIPKDIAQTLGLRLSSDVGVRYADGRTAQRKLAGGIQLTYMGRSSVFDAVTEPRRETALIGAIVLEALDLVVDCVHQKLSPRDPKQIISEVE